MTGPYALHWAKNYLKSDVYFNVLYYKFVGRDNRTVYAAGESLVRLTDSIVEEGRDLIQHSLWSNSHSVAGGHVLASTMGKCRFSPTVPVWFGFTRPRILLLLLLEEKFRALSQIE